MISHHAALIYTMVLVSASDRNMTDIELRKIGDLLKELPIFEDYNPGLLPQTAAACAELLDDADGLDRALDLVEAALPARLRETAYTLACEVAAVDQKVPEEEIRILEMLRHRLNLDRLTAAAIERTTRARYTRL